MDSSKIKLKGLVEMERGTEAIAGLVRFHGSPLSDGGVECILENLTPFCSSLHPERGESGVLREEEG